MSGFYQRLGLSGVYFITAPSAGMVKIGHSINADHRFHVLKCASPIPLELAALVEGSRLHETALHLRFRAEWSHAEWFRLSARIGDLISRLAAGATLADCGVQPALTVVRPYGRDYSVARAA